MNLHGIWKNSHCILPYAQGMMESDRLIESSAEINTYGGIRMSSNAAIVDISQIANKFSSSIVLKYDNKYIDVKSILGLFTTLVGGGQYELHVHGPDREEAIPALTQAFEKHNLKVTV